MRMIKRFCLVVFLCCSVVSAASAATKYYADEGAAYMACMSHASSIVSSGSPGQYGNPNCVLVGATTMEDHSVPAKFFRCTVGVMNTTFHYESYRTSCTDADHVFPSANLCASRPPVTGRPAFMAAGMTYSQNFSQCYNGCQTFWQHFPEDAPDVWTGVSTSKSCVFGQDDCVEPYYFSPLHGACLKPQNNCGSSEVKDPVTGACKQGCPAGMTLGPGGECKPKGADEPCPAGQVKGPDGSCVPDSSVCPAGQVKGEDGTCKPSGNTCPTGQFKDDSGQCKEGEGGGKFAGGENCDVPPLCSGNAIMCGQARIQWRIDCNTRKQAGVTGGTCDAMPVCTQGCDSLQYSMLIQQWRTACAVSKLGKDASGDGDGDPDFDAGAAGRGDVDAALSGTQPGPSDAFTDGSANNGGNGGVPGGTGQLDTTGFGYGRSCPTVPSVSFMGTTIDFQQHLGPLCDWMQLGGSLVLVMAALASLRIISAGLS